MNVLLLLIFLQILENIKWITNSSTLLNSLDIFFKKTNKGSFWQIKSHSGKIIRVLLKTDNNKILVLFSITFYSSNVKTAGKFKSWCCKGGKRKAADRLKRPWLHGGQKQWSREVRKSQSLYQKWKCLVKMEIWVLDWSFQWTLCPFHPFLFEWNYASCLCRRRGQDRRPLGQPKPLR